MGKVPIEVVFVSDFNLRLALRFDISSASHLLVVGSGCSLDGHGIRCSQIS